MKDGIQNKQKSLEYGRKDYAERLNLTRKTIYSVKRRYWIQKEKETGYYFLKVGEVFENLNYKERNGRKGEN